MGEGLRLKAHHTKLPSKADINTPHRNLRQSISDLDGEINVYAGVGALVLPTYVFDKAGRSLS